MIFCSRLRFWSLLFVIPLICLNAFSQQASDEATQIAISFNDQAPGKYQGARLKKDWPGLVWDHNDHASVVSRTDALQGRDGNCLKVTYPKGKIGSKEGGAIFRVKLKPQNEYYLDYWVRFGHGNGDHWDFSRGGKLPGLGGGKCNTGGHRSTGDGWSVRYMWRDGGRMIAYVYHMDQKDRYGDQIPLGCVFEAGRWYRMTQRVRVNNAGKKDGIIQVWVDGKLALDRHDFRFRKGKTAPVDHFLFSTFFGGSNDSWAPSKESYAYFDEFRIQPTVGKLLLHP